MKYRRSLKGTMWYVSIILARATDGGARTLLPITEPSNAVLPRATTDVVPKSISAASDVGSFTGVLVHRDHSESSGWRTSGSPVHDHSSLLTQTFCLPLFSDRCFCACCSALDIDFEYLTETLVTLCARYPISPGSYHQPHRHSI